MNRRCIFCNKKVDEKGRCQNQKCVDYARTKNLEAADVEKLTKAAMRAE